MISISIEVSMTIASDLSTFLAELESDERTNVIELRV